MPKPTLGRYGDKPDVPVSGSLAIVPLSDARPMERTRARLEALVVQVASPMHLVPTAHLGPADGDQDQVDGADGLVRGKARTDGRA